jgi:hypothetical protein
VHMCVCIEVVVVRDPLARAVAVYYWLGRRPSKAITLTHSHTHSHMLSHALKQTKKASIRLSTSDRELSLSSPVRLRFVVWWG